MNTDRTNEITSEQWSMTTAHFFRWEVWNNLRTGDKLKGLGGLREQEIRFTTVNHFHLTFSVGFGSHGQYYMTPSDETISQLLTFYDVTLFIALGGYHDKGQERFIATFKNVLIERKIGKHAMIEGWKMMDHNSDSKQFYGRLVEEFNACNDKETLNYLNSLRKQAREA